MYRHTERTLQDLMAKGLIHDDAEVLSDHNNLILRTPSRRTVSRVAKIASMLSREDPGDLRYSHEASWISADVAPVTRPIDPRAHESDGYIVSTYPERGSIDWASHDINDALFAISTFNDSLDYVSDSMKLRTIDIPSYAQKRLEFAADSGTTHILRHVDMVKNIIENHNVRYPFSELIDVDKGLVHGDLHATNLMQNDTGEAELIDMDSISIGPKTYDIASWRVRHELGDVAPVDRMVDIRRSQKNWSEETYRALMGWKIISSMTHAVRYETSQSRLSNSIKALGRVGIDLESLNVTSAELDHL